MAYDKIKDENYDNLGGINSKASEYITGLNQVLDLRNYSFIKEGAWTSRPGTADFASFPLATFITQPAGLYEFIKPDGVSMLITDVGPTLYAVESPPRAIGTSFTPNATTFYPFDFEISGKYLFIANGYSYQRFNGSYSVFYGPEAYGLTSYITYVVFDTTLDLDGVTHTVSLDTFFRIHLVKGGPTMEVGPVTDWLFSNPNGVGSEGTGNTTSLGAWKVALGYTIFGYGTSSALIELSPTAGGNYVATTFLPMVPEFDGSGTMFTARFSPFSLGSGYNNYATPFTLVPRFLESFKNMLFMSGFSTAPSTVYFSNIAEPEVVEPENFFEVRTGNADVITNMIAFQDSLIVFKKSSVHQVTGYSPDTLDLKDVNLSYGCINSTAAVTFLNKLWFMDERGICEFNGPDTFIVSHQVEDQLSTVDKTKCRAFHIKKSGEVWFMCNPKCFVYNYETEAWTIYDNFAVQENYGANILNFGVSAIDLAYVEKGASYIQFTRFNDSLYTDRGQAITLLAKTRFHKRLGDSTTELWRRLYVNADIPSSTLSVTVGFYTDYANSASVYRSFGIGQFQNRIDFGIPAKALSVEMIIKSSQQVRINGYTIESRYLRSV